MRIKTKAFGEIEVSEKQKIILKNGLLGFEDIYDFVLLDSDKNGSPFYWLQAEKIPEIAFVIIDPKLIKKDYTLKVDKEDLKDLELKNEDEMLLFSIVTIYETAQDITVNLLGPIVINKSNHYAKQVINQNDEYSVKYPLLEKGEAKC